MNTNNEFLEKLKLDYPSVFYEDGNVPCGFYCPEGWNSLVESLCEYIVRYNDGCDYVVAYPFLSKISNVWFKLVHRPVRNILYRLTCPYPKSDAKFRIISNEMDNAAKTKHPFKYKLHKRVNKIKTTPYTKMHKVCRTPIKIDQVKEKFGTLRFYVSNCPKEIATAIGFAEFMSGKICMRTGELGTLVRKQGYYATMSKEAADAEGFIKV